MFWRRKFGNVLLAEPVLPNVGERVPEPVRVKCHVVVGANCGKDEPGIQVPPRGSQ